MTGITKKNGSPTLYTLRKVLGMKAKGASNYNRCIGAQLSGNFYETPPEGSGGRNNEAMKDAFRAAKNTCKAGTMSKEQRRTAMKVAHDAKRATATKVIGVAGATAAKK